MSGVKTDEKAEEKADGKIDELLQQTAKSLASPREDTISQAGEYGFPNTGEVIRWSKRAKHLLLKQREESELLEGLALVADSLNHLLRSIRMPDGLSRESVTQRFMQSLPELRAILAEDVQAAYDGDPAAKSFAEIILSYPSIKAVATQRLANVLHEMGVPLLPRIMTEHAHRATGIDIHPGAEIGHSFFIDHGTGVVIGETTNIGDRVKLYQGVTLGALSFSIDDEGQMVRGTKRHPTIEDDVTIYAEATILGGETVIGKGSVIGGNVWLTSSVPPGSKVVIEPTFKRIR